MSSDNCESKITVSHDDPKVIKRIIKAYERGTLFAEFVKEDLEWDSISLTVISPYKIGLFTYTAWSPPLPILDHWVDLGCTVCCVFLEPCEWDVGIYKNKVSWRLRDVIGEADDGSDIEPSVQRLFAPHDRLLRA